MGKLLEIKEILLENEVFLGPGPRIFTTPQTIRLFVNDPKLVTPAYLAFIERSIRARFGLEGAPLRIFLKARPRGEAANRRQNASHD